MNGNLNLEMRLTANGSQLSAALNNAGANVRSFTNNVNTATRGMTQGFQKLYAQLNGFSTISKLAIAAGGYSVLSEALQRNLEFEKTLLEMKQLAGMTQKQAAQMRASAIEQSTSLLATPQEIAEGMKILANAGMKFEEISGTIAEAGRAALLFRSSIGDVANMDFDIQTKFKIDPSEMKKAHEMLYYHSKDGRFEAKSLSQYAPVYLNELKNVGISGMGGLNFVGALTQAIQQAAPATQPGEVPTMIKQGLAHIYSDGIGKKLKEVTGINIKKYASNHGKFYGKDGVDGLMDLALAMKKAGLDDQFKLQKAGFREQESRTFWLQLMNLAEGMREKMKNAEGDVAENLGDRDVQEIRNSNFGKMLKMDVAKAKGQVSEKAQEAVGMWASANAWAAENPLTAMAGGVAAVVGGSWLKKRLLSGGGANPLNLAANGIKGAGLPVTVTNWPASLGGGMKPSERLRNLPGNALPPAAGTAASGAAGGTLATAAAGTAMVATPAAIAYAANKYFNSNLGQKRRADGLNLEMQRLESRLNLQKGGGYQDKQLISQLEKQLAQMRQERDAILARLDAVANRPVQVQVQIDSHTVAESVNKVNGRGVARQ